jgi:cytochrome c556
MIRVMCALGALAVGAAAVLAQASPVEERNILMKAMWREAWGPVTRMAQGREPFDQKKADAGFARAIEIAQKTRSLWPDSAKGNASNASFGSTARVWENKADFDAKFADFIKVANENRPKVKDLDSLKQAFAATDKACDSCHEPYRVRLR